MRASARLGGRRGTPAAAGLGFLDVNFGVLGIFVVIFALRIILTEHQSGTKADLLAALLAGDAEGASRMVIYGPNGMTEAFEGTPVDIAAAARDRLLQLALVAERPLRMRLLLLKDGFDVEEAFSRRLSDDLTKEGAGFLAVATRLEPVVDLAQLEEIVAAWRGVREAADE